MSVTLNQVLSYLNSVEPDYQNAAKLGADAVPHLRKLLKDPDILLASKATYLASLISGQQSIKVLEEASISNHVEIRIAAASGLRNNNQVPLAIVDNLLKDQDAGVRKVTLRSLSVQPVKGIKTKVEQLGKSDPEVFIQNLANKISKDLE